MNKNEFNINLIIFILFNFVLFLFIFFILHASKTFYNQRVYSYSNSKGLSVQILAQSSSPCIQSMLTDSRVMSKKYLKKKYPRIIL